MEASRRSPVVRSAFALTALFAMTAPARPGDEPLAPPRIDVAPTLDGRLEEAEWKSALVLDDFHQRAPREGQPPSEATLVRIMYTASDLYVGVRAFDSRPEDVVATVMRRDNFAVVQNDQFVVAIDSFNDSRSGFWFSTNPLGVRVDARFFEEGEIWIGEWDGDWSAAARIDEAGWSAELRIPFSTLRFERSTQNVMGINLFRRLMRTTEELFSPEIPLHFANGTPNVSAARKLVFSGVSGSHPLRLRPYLLAGSDFRLAGRPEGGRGRLGGEAAYQLSHSLTALATLNTDFAHTEVDDRQINLTRFDLFLPEKRHFFIEDAGLFAFGVPRETELFFSRRIGIAAEAGGRSREVPLRLGGKLTGRVGRTELGVLAVDAERTDFGPAQGILVGRVKQALGKRSYVGAIGMARAAGGSTHSAFGLDGSLFLHGELGASGFIARTAESLDRGSTSGLAWNWTLFKRGERTAFRLAYTDVGPQFAPRLGFLLRSGVRELSASVRSPVYFRSGRFWRLVPIYDLEYVERRGGAVDTRSHRLTLALQTRSRDTFEAFASGSLDSVPRPFAVFRDVAVPADAYAFTQAGLRLATQTGRRLSGALALEGGGFLGGTSLRLAPRLQWKASRGFTAALEHESTWAELPAGEFRAAVWRLRLDYSLDTRLSSSALVQHDNSSRDLGFNLRVHYLFREGTELALVYTHVHADLLRDGAAGLQRGARDQSLLVKLTYQLGF